MSSSIESRFDKHNAPVLKGLGYLDPSQIANTEAWENILLPVQWFRSDPHRTKSTAIIVVKHALKTCYWWL